MHWLCLCLQQFDIFCKAVTGNGNAERYTWKINRETNWTISGEFLRFGTTVPLREASSYKVTCNFKTNVDHRSLTTYLFTDYGRPMQRSFFSLKSRTFGLEQTNWADKFRDILGIFSQTISTHFGTVSPLSMFSIIQPLFLQKTKPLYPNPKYVFGIGIWI